MSEWISCEFGSLYAEPSRNGLTKPKRVRGHGVKFVNMGEIFQYDRLKNFQCDRVPLSENEKFALLKNDDLLIARQSLVLAGAGKCSIFLGDFEEVAFESHIIRVRLDQTKANPLFYYYLFRSPQGRALIEAIVEQGAGASGVRSSDLQSLMIPYTSLPQQKAIAHILGSLDDKIELNRRMNETLEAMARAIFKDWFVDFGPTRAKQEGRNPYLPEHLWSLFPEAIDPQSGLPVGWENYRLDQISIYHRQTISPQKFPNEQFELYSLPGFDSGKSPTITQGKHIKSNKTVIPSDSVLLSKLNPEIQRVWLSEPPGKARQICSTEFLVFTPSKSTGKCFLLCLFNSNNFREMLKSMVTGTSKSHQRVSPKSLLSQTVIVGNLEVFSVFEQRTGCYLTLLQKNFVESRILAELRDALLPKLMSGEIRVKDAEKLVEEVL